jgi:hypothetical protein
MIPPIGVLFFVLTAAPPDVVDGVMLELSGDVEEETLCNVEVVLMELWELDPVRQSVVPGFILNAADSAIAPVLSLRVSPTEVPAAMSVFHIILLPFCWPRSSRAAADG